MKPFRILPIMVLWTACAFCSDGARAASVRDAWFGKDKAKHFLASAIIAGGVSWQQHRKAGRDAETSLRTGAGVTLSLGLAKEWSDRRNPGGLFSWKDLGADLLGTAFGVFVLGKW
jgi:putative lipoprotein